jgi:hypothetical protein
MERRFDSGCRLRRAPALGQRHDVVHRHRAHRARLQVLAAQEALLLERLQMVVHPVGRLDAEVLPDLAQVGGKPRLLMDCRNEIKDLLLAIGKLVVHRMGSPCRT